MIIVIKLGTSIMSKRRDLDYLLLNRKVKEMVKLIEKGHKLIVVASGAVAAGMKELGMDERPKDMLALQALSGIGQIALSGFFREEFGKEGVKVAQVLLTHQNFSTEAEKRCLKSVLAHYMDMNVVPIINENDVISNEELRIKSVGSFSDNDVLAAMVASEVRADQMLLVTDVEGLYDVDPNEIASANIIERIERVTPIIEKLASKKTNSMGRGGMFSKVVAAKMAKEKGIPTIVGSWEYTLHELLDGSVPRTLFVV